MWIEKTPRPWDFCGRVGCPICYGWGQDQQVEIEVTVEVTVAVTQELKAPVAPPTFDEQMLLVYGPDRPRPKTLEEYKYAHAYIAGEMQREDAEAAARLKEAEESEWLHRSITARRKQTQAKVDYKPLNTVTCDSIGGEAIEKALKEEAEAKLVTRPTEAPSDYPDRLKEQQAYLNKQRVQEQAPQLVRPWD